MPKVHTTYFGGLGGIAAPEPEDDVLSVVRHPKEFVEHLVDRNVPEVAPPPRLLESFRTVKEAAERDDVHQPRRVAWENVRFADRYHDHLRSMRASTVVERLRSKAANDEGDLWLVAWVEDPRWCHRTLLAEAIANGHRELDVEHHPKPDEIDDAPRDRTVTLDDFGGRTV